MLRRTILAACRELEASAWTRGLYAGCGRSRDTCACVCTFPSASQAPPFAQGAVSCSPLLSPSALQHRLNSGFAAGPLLSPSHSLNRRSIHSSLIRPSDQPSSSGGVSVSGEAGGELDRKPRKAGEGRDMMILFTCAKCNTRCVKTMSRLAYEKGVVIATCAGCQVKHLIADHLGWFGDNGTVEDFAKEKGEIAMRRTATGDFELTPEDLVGWRRAQEMKTADGAGDSSS